MRPASRITVQNGIHFQICDQITEPSASQREVSSQPGPSTPKKTHSMLLIRPHWPLSIQWIEMNEGSAGTAHGSTKISNSHFTHQARRMKKPDISSAPNIFRFTPRAR